MDGETGESIQGAERMVYKETSIGSFRYGQTNEDGGGCIRLCDGGSIIYGVNFIVSFCFIQ